MKTQKKSFVFNLEWAELLSDYPAEVRYEVYDAIIGYAASGTLSEMKPLAGMAFRFIKKEMDFNAARYDEISEIRRQAGRQGGAPVGNNNAEKQAKTSKNKQNNQNGINDNDNDNDNDIIPPITPRVGFETFGSFGNVFLKPAELRKLQMDYTPEAVSKAIEDLSCKLADGSQQSDNHCATLRYWLSFRRTADTSPKGKMEAADEIKRQTEQILGLQ